MLKGISSLNINVLRYFSRISPFLAYKLPIIYVRSNTGTRFMKGPVPEHVEGRDPVNMIVRAIQKMPGGHSPDAAWIKRLMDERRAGKMAGRIKNSAIFWKVFLIVSALIMLFPAASFAKMAVLADKELAGIVAYGFSSFTLVDGVARADIDINAWTYTEIDSLKLGYYDDGTTTGWDEDWTDVRIGSDTEDLAVSDLYIEAVFENIDDPGTRSLKSVKFGTADMTGSITGAFNSFSGDIAAGSPVSGHRLAPSFTSISFTGTGCHVSLNVDGVHKGYWIHWDNAATSP